MTQAAQSALQWHACFNKAEFCNCTESSDRCVVALALLQKVLLAIQGGQQSERFEMYSKCSCHGRWPDVQLPNLLPVVVDLAVLQGGIQAANHKDGTARTWHTMVGKDCACKLPGNSRAT